MRILVLLRDHPKPTPHTLQTMDTPPSIPPSRRKGGELSEGRCIAIAVEVALAIPPGKVRVPRGSIPSEKWSYTAIFGLTTFLLAASPCRVVPKKKKQKCVSTQNMLKISKKLSPKTPETVKSLSQRKFPDS